MNSGENFSEHPNVIENSPDRDVTVDSEINKKVNSDQKRGRRNKSKAVTIESP